MVIRAKTPGLFASLFASAPASAPAPATAGRTGSASAAESVELQSQTDTQSDTDMDTGAKSNSALSRDHSRARSGWQWLRPSLRLNRPLALALFVVLSVFAWYRFR